MLCPRTLPEVVRYNKLVEKEAALVDGPEVEKAREVGQEVVLTVAPEPEPEAEILLK